MQREDIPDLPILELMASPGPWFTHWEVDPSNAAHLRSLCPAFPPACPDKLKRAKMSQLIKRSLVTGCACGCRGDFEITDRGRSLVAAANSGAA